MSTMLFWLCKFANRICLYPFEAVANKVLTWTQSLVMAARMIPNYFDTRTGIVCSTSCVQILNLVLNIGIHFIKWLIAFQCQKSPLTVANIISLLLVSLSQSQTCLFDASICSFRISNFHIQLQYFAPQLEIGLWTVNSNWIIRIQRFEMIYAMSIFIYIRLVKIIISQHWEPKAVLAQFCLFGQYQRQYFPWASSSIWYFCQFPKFRPNKRCL